MHPIHASYSVHAGAAAAFLSTIHSRHRAIPLPATRGCRPSWPLGRPEQPNGATLCHPAGREKKNGRPVVFHGDPNDPRLSAEERRLLKRRIVNRESARRVRLRLRTDLEEQQRLIRSRPARMHACMHGWRPCQCR